MDQKPSVGRIVHYVSYGTPGGEFLSECRAAIVTDVPPDAGDHPVGLCVLNPTGQFFNLGVPYHGGDPEHVDATPGHPTYRGGTWHWPERV
jgi:hypothetical protein